MAVEGNSADESVKRLYGNDESVGYGAQKLLYIIHTWMVNDIQTSADLAKLSLGCQIMAHVSVFEYCATLIPQVRRLREALQKLGIYLRGVRKLYDPLTENEAVRKSSANFRLHHVPPPPAREIKLSKDWFEAVSFAYYRATKRAIPIDEKQLKEKLQVGLEQYEADVKHTMSLECHPEIILVNYYVLKINKPPTEIGVSETCCFTCYKYILAINKRLTAALVEVIWMSRQDIPECGTQIQRMQIRQDR
jgi:hypothetical protein